MEIEFDPDKDEANRIKHGISLSQASDFEFVQAVYFLDERRPYGEERWVAIGPISGRLHALVFTVRASRMRAISLRKANAREKKRYDTRR